MNNMAYCLECKCLVHYTPDRKFVDHQHGGLRPNGKPCSGSLQTLPEIVVPPWNDDEDDDDLQLYQEQQKKRRR